MINNDFKYFLVKGTQMKDFCLEDFTNSVTSHIKALFQALFTMTKIVNIWIIVNPLISKIYARDNYRLASSIGEVKNQLQEHPDFQVYLCMCAPRKLLSSMLIRNGDNFIVITCFTFAWHNSLLPFASFQTRAVSDVQIIRHKPLMLHSSVSLPVIQ